MQAELTGILDEVRRLSTISRKLLLLAQADAGRLNLYLEPFDLSKALAELVEDTRMLAPQLQITSNIEAGLIVPADGALLRQILHNLISNAIKYNVEQGWISFSAAAVRGGVEVEVANSSPGMENDERNKVFDRFYRADSAHDRKIEGVGLGLSVSREIARAHGGDLTLKKDDGGVVRLSLCLPRTAADSAPATSRSEKL
jgi:signal transduction histidine kinase